MEEMLRSPCQAALCSDVAATCVLKSISRALVREEYRARVTWSPLLEKYFWQIFTKLNKVGLALMLLGTERPCKRPWLIAETQTIWISVAYIEFSLVISFHFRDVLSVGFLFFPVLLVGQFRYQWKRTVDLPTFLRVEHLIFQDTVFPLILKI